MKLIRVERIERKMMLDFNGGNLNMENDKVKFLIDMINDMKIKDKLRLAIRMSESDYTNLKYNKPEEYQYFYNMLSEIDEEYRTTILNFRKYYNVTFAMDKIIEITKEEQNQVALYLFNNIKKIAKD